MIHCDCQNCLTVGLIKEMRRPVSQEFTQTTKGINGWRMLLYSARVFGVFRASQIHAGIIQVICVALSCTSVVIRDTNAGIVTIVWFFIYFWRYWSKNFVLLTANFKFKFYQRQITKLTLITFRLFNCGLFKMGELMFINQLMSRQHDVLIYVYIVWNGNGPGTSITPFSSIPFAN